MTSSSLQFASAGSEPRRADDVRSFGSGARLKAHRPVVCHFTTAHSALKSRSFHRQCVPLAEAGFEVRYVSPAQIAEGMGRTRFVSMAKRASLAGHAMAPGRLLRTLLQQRADVYYFQDPQLLPLGMLLKLVFRKRVIYDAYEDFPSMAAHKMAMPAVLRLLAAKAIAAAEWMGAHCFDGVITADPLTMRRLARPGQSHRVVFYNFPNLDFFPRPHQNAKRFDLVYRGGLSKRTGTFLLLDALHSLVREGRRLRLLLIGYGDGAESERLLRGHIAARGLTERVEMRGRIPHEEMSAALAEARIGISPLMDVPKFRLNIPVKIFEYWACGLPVIASDLPPSRPFLSSSGAGISFPAGDVSALARSIAYLVDHPEEAEEMGARGRAMVEARLNNAAEMRKFISLCSRLLPQSMAATMTEYEHA